MKTAFAFFLLPLLLSSTGTAQMKQGSWEVSTSITGGSLSYEYETTSQFGTSSSNSSATYLSLVMRPGYYLIDGLAVEPEFQIYAIERQNPRFVLAGNVSYNFGQLESKIIPFILAGYGVSNSSPSFFPGVLILDPGSMDVGVLNLGAGAKFVLGDQVAFRCEYRFQQFKYTENAVPPVTSTTKYTYAYNNVLIGISILIP